MQIEFAARTEKGRRESNDDRALVSGQILDGRKHAGFCELPALAAVCDGCGGYRGGGLAAELVLELLASHPADALRDSGYLARVLQDARHSVAEKQQADPGYSEMCTTLAGCVFDAGSILIFHAGDSRVYRMDRWGLAPMTRDHSLVQEMVDWGELTPEQALTSPRRNIITRCIGTDCPAPELYVSHVTLHPGEKYLICSDGLWESVRDPELEALLSQDLPLSETADRLVEAALSNGADDNISVCVIARSSGSGQAAKSEGEGEPRWQTKPSGKPQA